MRRWKFPKQLLNDHWIRTRKRMPFPLNGKRADWCNNARGEILFHFALYFPRSRVFVYVCLFFNTSVYVCRGKWRKSCSLRNEGFPLSSVSSSALLKFARYVVVVGFVCIGSLVRFSQVYVCPISHEFIKILQKISYIKRI